MRTKYVKTLILVITVFLIGILPVAGVDTGEVSFKLNFKQGPFDGAEGTNIGRWHAKGVFGDGGKALDDYTWVWDSDTEVTMTSSYVLGGKKGTIVIDVVLHTNARARDWVKNGELKFEGTWTINSDYCTGDYTGLSGRGDAVQLVHVTAASNAAGGDQTFGSPAMSNRVFLEGTID